MSCISEFTNDVRHLHGDQNVVADALSRVEINNVKFFQEGLNYNEIAKAQQDDAFIKSLIENPSKSSLKFSEVKIEDSDQVILCDVSTDKVRPISYLNSFKKLSLTKFITWLTPALKPLGTYYNVDLFGKI